MESHEPKDKLVQWLDLNVCYASQLPNTELSDRFIEWALSKSTLMTGYIDHIGNIGFKRVCIGELRNQCRRLRRALSRACVHVAQSCQFMVDLLPQFRLHPRVHHHPNNHPIIVGEYQHRQTFQSFKLKCTFYLPRVSQRKSKLKLCCWLRVRHDNLGFPRVAHSLRLSIMLRQTGSFRLPD